jgi:Arc/MetJ-type ribon-helix-helix transcriptional regulator
MAIVVSRDVEQQIEDLVQSEQFDSANEFLRQCVEGYRRAKKLREKQLITALAGRDDIQKLIEEGVRDLEEGRYTDYDDEGLKALCEQIKREGRQELGLPAAGH